MAGLTGCGIHLEEHAPSIPLIPKRTPIPGESGLLELLHGTQVLADAFGAGAGGSRSAAFAAVHAREAAVLDSALRRKAVPADLLARPTGSTPSATTLPGSVLAREQAAIVLVGRLYADAPLDLLPSLAALAAARTVVCRALASVDSGAGTPGTSSAAPSASSSATPDHASDTSSTSPDAPSDTSTSTPDPASASPETSSEAPGTPGAGGLPRLSAPTVVLPFLAASRAAVYGLEVVAARTHGRVRTAAAASLESVRGLALTQESAAGAAAPPAPSAYRLPLSVEDDDSARRLAEYLVRGLVAAYAAALTTATESGTHASDGQIAAARGDVVVGADWLAEVALLADDWGLPLEPFPGLS